MFQLQRYRFGVAHFLFFLYVAVQINGIVFRHAHRLADGTIICHAHPYKSSPGTQFPNHAHSQDELIWLDAFSNAPYTDPGAFVWTALLVIASLLTIAVALRPQRLRSSIPVAFWHRGPPVHLV